MKEKEKPKVYSIKDLPPNLRNKYKDSTVFKENNRPKKQFKFDLQELKKKKAEKQKTIQQKLEEFKLNSTEQKYLNGVFKTLSAQHNGEYFTTSDLENVLNKMGMKNKMNKKEIALMIWQIDQKLDNKISQKQFTQMYKKCMFDNTGIQPKKIFHLTQFLMYCRPNKFTIIVEDTLQLLYVRVRKQSQTKKINQKYRLDQQIAVIFGDQQKTPDGIQRQVTFEQYLQKINKRAIERRKQQLHNKNKTEKV